MGSCVSFFILVLFLRICIKQDELERIALPCRFALDIRCDKSCPQHWRVIARRVNIYQAIPRGRPEAPLLANVETPLRLMVFVGYAVSGLGCLCSSVDLRTREHNVLRRMGSRNRNHQSSLLPVLPKDGEASSTMMSFQFFIMQ